MWLIIRDYAAGCSNMRYGGRWASKRRLSTAHLRTPNTNFPGGSHPTYSNVCCRWDSRSSWGSTPFLFGKLKYICIKFREIPLDSRDSPCINYWIVTWTVSVLSPDSVTTSDDEWDHWWRCYLNKYVLRSRRFEESQRAKSRKHIFKTPIWPSQASPQPQKQLLCGQTLNLINESEVDVSNFRTANLSIGNIRRGFWSSRSWQSQTTTCDLPHFSVILIFIKVRFQEDTSVARDPGTVDTRYHFHDREPLWNSAYSLLPQRFAEFE